MAKVGTKRAAELTGKSKSTITRAMNGHKVSFERDENGHRMVDVSELERYFGLKKRENAEPAPDVQNELEKAKNMLEAERLKMRIKMLEEQLITGEKQIDDLKSQRDLWQNQANQVLITSQYSQKQAEKFETELNERKKRAEERRQQMISQNTSSSDKPVSGLRAENQNRPAIGSPLDKGAEIWKKIKNIGA